MIRRIIEFASLLKEVHGACALKLGTEAEANSFQEIAFFTRLLDPILPVVVKIGGCDARNDIKTLHTLGVRGLIAPMIESEYALRNFLTALKSEIGSDFKKIYSFLAINIESRTGYQNLEEILDSPDLHDLDQLTIGRTDFSSSCGMDVESDELYDKFGIIARKAQAKGLLVSVGGQITPGSVTRIKKLISPEKVNIRTVVISLKNCPDPVTAIRKSLEFEVLLLKLLLSESSSRSEHLSRRIEIIEERLAR